MQQQAEPQDATIITEGDYTITTKETSALATVITAEIDSQIATAKAYPRSIHKFKQRALTLATMSQEVAASCEYGLPRGGKVIKGPSVRLAEIIVNSWGNVRAGARVVLNTGRKIVSQAICHDLETNVCITIEVERRITDKKGIPYNEDMQIMAGNAASSIALRNAIFKVVPKAAWDEIYQQSRFVALGDASTLVERRTKAVEYFRSKGVTDPQICQALGVNAIDDIDLDRLATLSSMKSALVNNEASLETLFPPVEDPKKKADDASKATEDKLNKSGKAGAKKTVDRLEQGLADTNKSE